ncbi:hypothetical protein DFJ74DRAFT_672817 [Hyaloraphidium curvatum]|nr:hypothetical protein DFJ74DRAFT_672817 [Hyaloraphidium curvatum]
MDTIVLRDMDEFLELDALSSSSLRSPDPSAPAACEKTHQFVIAKEGTWGAANAVMLSARNATFLRAWRLLYQFFNDSVWADHSVYQPRKLAEQLPEQVTLLEQGAFLDPLFGPQDLDRVYAKGSAHDWPRWQYAYHGWESRAAARYNFSEIFEPRYVMKVDSAINRLVRPYMEELVGQGLKVG